MLRRAGSLTTVAVIAGSVFFGSAAFAAEIGKHTIKFGGQAMYQYYNGFGRQCISGCMTFDFKHTGRGLGDTNFTTAGGSPTTPAPGTPSCWSAPARGTRFSGGPGVTGRR